METLEGFKPYLTFKPSPRMNLVHYTVFHTPSNAVLYI